MESPDVKRPLDEFYEEQYHPEVDIFGRGDPFKKANNADDVVQNQFDQDSDEEDESES